MANGNDAMAVKVVEKEDGGDKIAKSIRRKGYIPYKSVYKTQDEVRRYGYWIPGVPIHAKIINVGKDTTTNYHILNPFLYTIELQHGRYTWTVVRRYKDFSYLSQRLIAHRAVERIKAPVRRARSKIEDAMDGYDEKEQDLNQAYELQILEKVKDMSDFGLSPVSVSPTNNGKPSIEQEDEPVDIMQDVTLPRFPLVPDAVIGEGHMNERKERLEKWLQCVLSIPVNRDYHETAEFLEVSRFSFINELGGKYKEGELKKRPGGSKVYIGCKNFCVRWLLPWGHRWLMVKDTYVSYMNPSNEDIRLVLLFDEMFEIDNLEMGVNIKPKYMVLSNLQHVLATKCPREEDARLWKETIRGVLDTTGAVWLRKKRFGSSFPVRENSHAQYFVDAKDYWEKAAAMLEIAREEVFIADWWLCPEIYMKRPMAEGNYWQLGEILKRIATRGVKIFVLLYKEMELALTLDSKYSKRYLQDLHPNIHVIRHPDHYFGTGTFFWAHHEKLLIIDQLIAFVGGLDLCYGRWDNSSHPLSDLGSVQFSPRSEGIIIKDNLADAVEEVAEPHKRREKSVIDEIDEQDDGTPAEIRIIQEDIIDDKGQKIGIRTTRMVKSADQEPTSRKNRFREVMNRAIRSNKNTASSDSITGQTRSTSQSRSRSQSRSPAPRGKTQSSDDRSPASRRPHHRRPDLKELFDVHHNRPRQIHHAFPFGPVDRVRFRNFQTGMDPSQPNTPDVDISKSKETRSLDFDKIDHTPTTPSKHRDLKTASVLEEPHSRTLMRRVVSNLKTNRSKKRWQMVMDKQDDAAEEYVINFCKVQETDIDVSGLKGAGKLWQGKDYVNYLVRDFVDVHDAYTDFINRYEVPRTPWHDIHSVVYGDPARDVARHFIQRWNAAKTEKLKDKDEYPYLLPKSYDSVKIPRVFLNRNTHNVDIQVLRSVAHWSILIDKTEDSIQQAYLSLIANAEHYIYIENQFFVSMINSSEVTNEICRVICDRIVRAHREGKTFRVYILIPLLPGFEGKINATDYSALLAVLHWTMLSISQGDHSLLVNLNRNGVEDPWKYLSFCSLRAYDQLGDKLVSELIYIHCKLLIVDDKKAIIGSANINDRSQVGSRDSEVCVLIEDREFEDSTMDGQPYQAGKFASSLRKRCMSEHLGLHEEALHKAEPKKPISLDDPISDKFYEEIWKKTAAKNTEIFEEVFRCYPTNLVTSYEELQAWQAELPMVQYNEELARSHLQELVGTLVQFPHEFLKSENLAPTITSKEGIVPSSLLVASAHNS
ncbi:Phospholipase [Aphelenchoides besseyi]|nr:Phospholipase [Aphelenchoides besseyi]